MPEGREKRLQPVRPVIEAAVKGSQTGRDRPQAAFTAPSERSFRALLARYRQKREARRDFEFLPATLEVLERPPAPFARAMLLFVIVFAAFVLAWAIWTGMDIVVSDQGMVVPTGRVKIVQPVEPGLVTAARPLLVIDLGTTPEKRRSSYRTLIRQTFTEEELQFLRRSSPRRPGRPTKGTVHI